MKTKCPVLSTVHVLGKAWTIPIMEEMYFSKDRKSFCEIKAALKGVTSRELSYTLKDLQRLLQIDRKTTKVGKAIYTSYGLTASGKAVGDALKSLKEVGVCYYGITNKKCATTKCSTCTLFQQRA